MELLGRQMSVYKSMSVFCSEPKRIKPGGGLKGRNRGSSEDAALLSHSLPTFTSMNIK